MGVWEHKGAKTPGAEVEGALGCDTENAGVPAVQLTTFLMSFIIIQEQIGCDEGNTP
jgi:hypothetical protein